MRRLAVATFLLLPFTVLSITTLAPAQPPYDLIIRGGQIVDGSGSPRFAADLGIRQGRIAAIGTLCASGPCDAKRTIKADGLVVAPGFIDVHTHADIGIRRFPTADNFLFDGVTSVIAGNCGQSPLDLESFLAGLRDSGSSVNFGLLIGHGAVRSAVMGMERRDPTEAELTRMEAMVERGMRQGAFGLSTGLIYPPGSWARTAEIITLARVAARFGGIYASHIRDEEGGIFEAINEAIEVGRQARLPVQISHFKVVGKSLWGESSRTVAMVESAHAAGLDVTVDQYPYTAASTGLAILLPSWVQEGGGSNLLERLADPATRLRLVHEAKQLVENRGFSRLDYVVIAHCPADSSLEGKSITEITRERGRGANLEAEIETVLDIMANGGAEAVYHSMDEKDVEQIMRFPSSMVASDGLIVEMGIGLPHPRNYATNARVLGRYVREKRLLRLEEAVRKMTSFPAQRFRLRDRGLIRPGMCADLVIFDDQKIADVSTFAKPHALPLGFRCVIVNGTVVIENGKHTGARPGQILMGPGKSERSVSQQ